MVFTIAFAPIPFTRYNGKPVRRSRVVYKTLDVHIGTLRRLKENSYKFCFIVSRIPRGVDSTEQFFAFNDRFGTSNIITDGSAVGNKTKI